jgi:hypothetical protein
VRKLFSRDTSSVDTLATLKKWVHECDSDHRECHATTAAPFPRRVLDLRSGQVKLQERMKKASHYACLSHCWGSGNSITKTTSSTKTPFGSRVHFRMSILQNVRVCVSFVWIDSESVYFL